MIRNLLLIAGILACSLASYAGGAKSYHLPAGVSASDYAAKTIIIRVQPGYRSLCSNNEIAIPALQKVMAELNITSFKKVFPNHQPPEQMYNSFGKKYADLSLIYEITYAANADLIKSVNRLLQTEVLVYAEPKFIPKVCFNPNDPLFSQQNWLNIISAPQAWNVSQGDTNVVIGITDTGTDPDHPDLAANLKRNYADPINGTDDDGDGYVDNFNGWDVGENDNNTIVGNCATCSHGSHVSGCAAAVTNNNTGVASPGFNCKFLPVKIANASGALSMAYEGITYAADHGCQIINCSWGGPGGSSFGQDVIDYATINKNSLVIAAAGNNNSSSEFFPAAYQYVVCVGSTNSVDGKSSFSNYGTYLDVCAPGSSILSTYYDNNYSQQSGTSMASPIVAGAAGLVKAVFPTYNALQIGEQLRVTCDNIYNLSANAGYQFQLGNGRINMLNAITLSGPSVRMENIISPDNNDNVLVIGDTMRISGDIINYLSPTTNLTATLSTTSSFVTIIDNSTLVGALGTLALTNTSIDPFTVKVNPSAPQNAVIPFRLTFTDGSYTAVQSFTVTVNVDYINIMNNDVFTTNTSRGRIGYNTDGQLDGKGFDYNDEGSMMYEGGLMIGRNSNVSDVVRGDNGTTADEDFVSMQNVAKNDPGVWSDFDTYGQFNDNSAAVPHNVSVRHRTMSWTLAPFNKFHIFEYSIRNAGNTTLTNFYAGIFSDWDIQTYANNKSAADANLKMGYSWCTDAGGYYAGIKLLTSGPFNFYGIDNVGTGNGGVNLSDGFTSAEKFTTLSTSRVSAGGTGTGNDVIDVVSTGPFNITANDSVVVAFAIIAGTELSDLQSSAQQAQIKYDLVTSINETSPVLVAGNAYPNPVRGLITIPVYLKSTAELQLEVMDAMGRVVDSRDLGSLTPGLQEIKVNTQELAVGSYIYRLKGSNVMLNGKFQKQ